ncbi:MAG: DUF1844 domain-containing protein [Ignavibacteriae bacterium]|nr:MAG: DUF1844 domain-containing protein [Ignavibacteriota bacterium]
MELDKNSQLLMYLISSFEMTALQQMGKLKDPLLDKLERNLQQAQFSIDLLDMLKEKTKGNISSDESRYLENVLAQLKLNFVDEVEKDRKENLAKAETKPEDTPQADTSTENKT